jgi:hypothetical protein
MPPCSDVTGTAIFTVSPSPWIFVQNINMSILEEDIVISVESMVTN